MIYHITTQADWQTAKSVGHYTTPSLEVEGFIHNSTREQILKVANAFYRGVPDLVILCIDETKLSSPLKWEAPVHPNPDTAFDTDSEEVFPHIFGTLNIDAVVNVVMFPEGQDGFSLPSKLP